MFSEKDIERLNRFAEELNLKLHISMYDIFVTSNKGNWLIQIFNNKIRLWHENFSYESKSQSISKSYHLQKNYMPNIKESLIYIAAHDKIRYTMQEKYTKFA